MHTVIIAIAGASLVVAVGLVGAYWILNQNLRAIARQKMELQRAREALSGVRDLAVRMAKDANAHGRQVHEISNELTSVKWSDVESVVGAVARLVQANQQLEQRMNEAETRLGEHSRALETYVVEARTDALTGLPNRRFLDAEIARHSADFQRHETPFSIILLDLDKFKRINDEFGHLVGDEVLRTIASVLQRCLRGIQRVSRFGGDEFLVTLPATSVEEACRVAEDLRQSTGQTRFHFQEKDISVTFSAGVAQLLAGEQTQSFLNRADQTLLVAKRNWRNAICWNDGHEVYRIRDAELALPAGPAIATESARELCGQEQSSAPLDDSVATAPQGPGPISAAGDLERPAAALPRRHAENSMRVACDSTSPMPPLACDRSRMFLLVRQRLAEWKRGGSEFAVLLLRMNDCNHPAGPDERASAEDTAQIVRRMLSANLRDMDIVGNYAPGCLVLLLPQARLCDAAIIAERLIQATGQIVLSSNSGSEGISVAAGIAEVRQADDAIRLFQRAEAALAVANRNEIGTHDGSSINVSAPGTQAANSQASR
jgi:diguanylate cyclase (GGDEF)-like protein